MSMITLNEFIMERQADFPFASGDLSRLLADISIAAKIINHKVNKAGLQDILGAEDTTNVQGETQMKLDVFSDQALLNAVKWGGQVCGAGSEENEKYFAFEMEHCRKAKYVILFDPLDGSSNIDVNVSIGTIFSILRRKSAVGDLANINDFLQKGCEQVAAGYVIYGSSTMLVYTTGHGVNGFTLEPSIGEFCLSHANMKFPEMGSIYSINEGHLLLCEKGIQDYVAMCKSIDKKNNLPYTARYIGSLVADFHRNLIKGGIYMYPGTQKNPQGKLRLQYECNPLAFIAEQAGGKASDGHQRILDLTPKDLHQRTPFIVGPVAMVEQAEAFILKGKN
jgi:fructose-1,6-bisphosphatase I